MTKTVKISEKDLKYLKVMVSSELEKFDEVAKTTRDPDIKAESKILNNLNRQLSV
jgi:hypothetical protein